MEFPVPSYTTFVIPTGATTGARIVIDGTTGKIEVYNSSNILVDTIGGPNGDIISTDGTRVVDIVSGAINLVWNGSGMTNDAAITIGAGGPLFITSGTTAASSKFAQLELVPNSDSVTDLSAPQIIVQSNATNGICDLLVNGTVIKSSNGAAVQWNNPTSFGTGWAQGTGIGGNYPNLQWRYDAEDNVHIHGVFHVTQATPPTLIASGFPIVQGANVGVCGAAAYTGQNFSLGCYLDTSGNLHCVTTAGITDTTATFLINAKVPLRNLS